MADIYVNPFTDYGFKKIFGEEPNKDLLLDFLNELLKEEQGKIVSLTYLKTEQQGYIHPDRKAIFDVYCENEKGEKFIVELQKTKQNFFKDRMLYYSTFPFRDQAKQNWNFELKAVYAIAILDFVFGTDKVDPNKYRYNVKLTDMDTHKVFYDKLTFVYLEMPKFNKSVDELNTRFEKWLYVLRNMNRLERVPDKLKEKIFEKVFETARVANFNQDELYTYEASLKTYWDTNSTIQTARDDGKKDGIKEGMVIGMEQGVRQGLIQVALNLLSSGMDIQAVSKATGLSPEEIEALRNFIE